MALAIKIWHHLSFLVPGLFPAQHLFHILFHTHAPTSCIHNVLCSFFSHFCCPLIHLLFHFSQLIEFLLCGLCHSYGFGCCSLIFSALFLLPFLLLLLLLFFLFRFFPAASAPSPQHPRYHTPALGLHHDTLEEGLCR